jgi:hypothetical protein
MASYAPDYTPRYKAHYTAAGIQHSMQFRMHRGITDNAGEVAGAAACTVVCSYLEARLPVDFAWTSAEYAQEDSPVFVPVATLPDPIVGEIALAALSAVERITSTTFAARGAFGRTRVSIYCPDWDEDVVGELGSRGIINGADYATIANIVTGLNALNASLATNGNSSASWYSRATIKRNDHLLKLVRRGLTG